MRSRAAPTGGGGLDIDGAGEADDSQVEPYACDTTKAQVWELLPEGQIQNPNSGCRLSVPGDVRPGAE